MEGMTGSGQGGKDVTGLCSRACQRGNHSFPASELFQTVEK